MKNLKQKIILCACVIMTGFIAACSNPYMEHAGGDKAGNGNLLISIAGGNGRTILPIIDGFSRYELEIAKNGTNIGVPQDLSGITGSGVNISLPAGEYTVTVKAYRGDLLAAQGNKTVTVKAGSNTAIAIELKPFIGAEKGFFNYNITLPPEAVTAALNLKSKDGSFDQTFDLIANSASSAPIELPAGYYEMIISLAKSDDKTGDYHVVHIYSGMETGAVLDLSNAFAAINLETLAILIKHAEKELTRIGTDGDITISDDGADVWMGSFWVTQAAVDALKAALADAKNIMENPPNKQGPVNQARIALEAALFTPQYGTKFDDGDWKGLLGDVETLVKLTINSSASAWTLSIPLLNDQTVTGAYTVSDRKVIFMKDGAVYANGTPSADTLTLNLSAAILGADTLALTKGTPAPKDEIEYLFSGIWMNTSLTAPVITYISADKWTFSLPYNGEKVNGTFMTYDRKAAFYTADGAIFAVAKVAAEQPELTGNTLTIYPLTNGKADGSYTVTLNPYPIPFMGNWNGGETIGGTLYVSSTTWTLEDESGVLSEGEYVWNGNEAYFISNGAHYATGTINDGNDILTVVTVNGVKQEFTLITSPFIGAWKGTVMLIVTVNAAVTGNTYAITSIAGNTNGQYTWRTENGTTTAHFYSNGYSYGIATLAVSSGKTTISVDLDEPISAMGITIKNLTLTKQ